MRERALTSGVQLRELGGCDVGIWATEGSYRSAAYENEADLEDAIIQVQKDLFGTNRHYLDVKKKIGAKGSIQNIPDGYLLDLSARNRASTRLKTSCRPKIHFGI